MTTVDSNSKSGLSLDLMEQLTFYGAYHTHPFNQLIHVIFVPLIWYTLGIFLWYTGEIEGLSSEESLLKSIMPRFDGAAVLFLLYGLYYPMLDRTVGTCCSFLYYMIYRQIDPFVQHFGESRAWKVALALHVFSWYMQIHPGHVMIEKRKPALVDSFFQSVALAPLFVWYEIWFFFGYNPEMKRKLDERIDVKVKALNKENKAKMAS